MNGPTQPDTGRRLLIVSDQRLLREALEGLFRVLGEMDVAAGELAQTGRIVQESVPDVVLLSLGPSGRRSLVDLGAILVGNRSSRWLLVDDTVRPVLLCTLVAAGGYGYWTKDASFDQLAEAVRQVAAGRPSFCPEAQKFLVPVNGRFRFQPPNGTATVASLSRRESQVLSLLSDGLTVRECAERLQLSPSTVDNHRWRMMMKLGIHKLPKLIRLAIREGLVTE